MREVIYSKDLRVNRHKFDGVDPVVLYPFRLCLLCNHWYIEQLSIEFNQSNYFGQSQRTQSNPLSNQNLKQLHETWENLREQVFIGFGFTSDWFGK